MHCSVLERMSRLPPAVGHRSPSTAIPSTGLTNGDGPDGPPPFSISHWTPLSLLVLTHSRPFRQTQAYSSIFSTQFQYLFMTPCGH